jgi:hypothetical protein
VTLYRRAPVEQASVVTTRSIILPPSDTSNAGTRVARFARGVALSPDGRWVAYVSDESGRQEIYVREFPGMSGRRQVSLDGGIEPVWSRRGDEILYRNGPALLAAAVRTSPQFEVVSRRTLFSNPDYAINAYEPNYDLSADGQRLVMVRGIGRSGGLSITLNWFENLQAGRAGAAAEASGQ